MNIRIKRLHFEKLNDSQKGYTLRNQNLSWFKREDFEKLNDDQKVDVFRYQNLSWFKREDF